MLGALGDRLGVKPVLIAGLTVQALAIVSYAYISRLGEFYALAVIFGTAYGGVMPLYAVLAREYFGQRIMGTVFGAVQRLRLAVHRLGCRRARRRAAGADLPAAPARRPATGVATCRAKRCRFSAR